MGKCSQKGTKRLHDKAEAMWNLHQADANKKTTEASIKCLICTLKEASCKLTQLFMLNNERTISSCDSGGSILLHELAYGESFYSGASCSCFWWTDTRTPFIILMWPETGADRRWSSQMSLCYDITSEEWAAGVDCDMRVGRAVWYGWMDGPLWDCCEPNACVCTTLREWQTNWVPSQNTHTDKWPHYVTGTLDNYDLCDMANESCYHYVHLQTSNMHEKAASDELSRKQLHFFFFLGIT